MSLDLDHYTDEALTTDAEPDDPVVDATPPAAGDDGPSTRPRRWPPRVSWRRVVAFGLLPLLALFLAAGAGYLKWQDDSAGATAQSATASVRAATESTIAMLAYQPDTVERDLTAAADRLTGSFRDDYLELIHDVVIPGSVAKRIGAVASVPAAASVSATADYAVVLVYVNQTTTIAGGAPTNSISSVQVTLDKVGDRWLVSQFQPI